MRASASGSMRDVSGIAGRQRERDEREDGDPEQDRDRDEDAANDVGAHRPPRSVNEQDTAAAGGHPIHDPKPSSETRPRYGASVHFSICANDSRAFG